MDKEIQSFLDKIKKLEKSENLDLSSGEDLSIGIMNLISIEEHLFFSWGKTKAKKYLEILNDVRSMRKDLLKRIIKDYEGEVWCMSKHLLAASMRLIEVGTKMLSKGGEKEAEEMFKKAYDLYSLFWGLNLNLVDTKNLKADDEKKLNFLSENINENYVKKVSIFDKLGAIVKSAVDCCKE
ncbi:hypothetical protein KJ664_01125 [Patescibacteria group bacterium]|nr:hypothetical protein [Patescibacteria group bacterium]